MLQFDDASLARLIRAVRAVPYDKRKIFLKKLGAAIDPSSALRGYRNRNGPLPLVVVDAADSRPGPGFLLEGARREIARRVAAQLGRRPRRVDQAVAPGRAVDPRVVDVHRRRAATDHASELIRSPRAACAARRSSAASHCKCPPSISSHVTAATSTISSVVLRPSSGSCGRS